ncbi:hypothetical protein MLD38_038667 [Melastoma candidum]|uniref:Uncharacterized protein n=1 Tax=Melastoma candidum TaxID=119954 RepID=A0ACB9L1Y2_9MYRT|nr:hypothetical protein MLD38_038667 [Melastoma candidum]
MVPPDLDPTAPNGDDDDPDADPLPPPAPLVDDDDLNSPSTSSSLLPTATPIDPLLSSSSVTVVIPAPSSSASAAVAAGIVTATAPSDRKPLFQRLWTDEDEIELLQGFLLYTSQRGGATTAGGAPHHDTLLFYDQIKSKLQLDFNKNQLVEKLRRLKKKYRSVVTKISSGKDFSFKSPHDQATFEISRKIWSNSIGIVGNLNNHVNSDLNIDDDDDDEIVRGHGFVNSVIPSFNLNPRPNLVSEIKNEDFHRMTTPVMGLSSSKSRKRMRLPDRTLSSAAKTEDRNKLNLGVDGNSVVVNSAANGGHNLMNLGNLGNSSDNVGNSMGGLIDGTVRSCLAPVFNELLAGGVLYGGGLNKGRMGGIAAALNPLPFGIGGMGIGEGGSRGDERWRKQHIMELEVFSQRLELVQEQIKAILAELLSKGG